MENIDVKSPGSAENSSTVSTIDIVVIDVRDPEEFAAFHLPNSINMPMPKIRPQDFDHLSGKVVTLICNSGFRARAVAKRLDLYGYDNIYVAEKQLKDLDTDVLVSSSKEKILAHGWTVDRQFRLTLGILMAIFLGLFFLGVHMAVAIPSILATGLIVTSIIDRCYMRIAIGKLPWNN